MDYSLAAAPAKTNWSLQSTAHQRVKQICAAAAVNTPNEIKLTMQVKILLVLIVQPHGRSVTQKRKPRTMQYTTPSKRENSLKNRVKYVVTLIAKRTTVIIFVSLMYVGFALLTMLFIMCGAVIATMKLFCKLFSIKTSSGGKRND